MILFYYIILLLVICCNNNETEITTIKEIEKEKVKEMDEITVNVIDTLIQGDNINITIEIFNKDSIDYHLIYSYKGDLDKREFPSINKKGNNLSVKYEPFYSEKVSDYYLDHQDDDPTIIIPLDRIGIQILKSKDKRIITLNFPFNHTNIDNLEILLYFGKYLGNENCSDEIKFYYIPPTKEFYSLFCFIEQLIKIEI